jgi:hypothetical protein
VVAVDGGGTTVQTEPAFDGLVEMLANTIGTPFGGWFGKPVYGAVVNAGKTLAAVGAIALPVLYCGCTTPASDGGTGAGATAGPTNGPAGTVPIGGGVGGGKVGTPTGSPIEPSTAGSTEVGISPGFTGPPTVVFWSGLKNVMFCTP